MEWGSLSTGQQILVLLGLKGGPEYRAQMFASSRATAGFGRVVRTASGELTVLTRRTWLQNQAMFTLRRYAFYATLAVTAAAFSVARLGYAYYSALQTAKVALQPLFKDTPGTLDSILKRLYLIAALSPFLFKDMTIAFRNMYPAFKAAGLGAGITLRVIQSITDAMSLAGRTAPGQLNRVSVALQHMALMGRPLGFTVTQLDRLGVPFTSALRSKFHLTAEQLHNIGGSGITAKQALQALVEYIQKTPGYAGAAARQANRTLSGAWAQLKDFIGMAAAQAGGGVFGGLLRLLQNVNNELAKMFKANKPVTLTTIVSVIDRQLSPSTHMIINLWTMMVSTLHTLILEFGLLFKTISILLWPLDHLANLFGANRISAKLFGILLGTLIFQTTLLRLRTVLLAEAQLFLWVIGKRIIAMQKLQLLWTILVSRGLRVWAFEERAVAINSGLATVAVYTQQSAIARLVRTIYTRLVPGLQAATAATWEFTIALLLNPITLIVAAVLALTVGLTILYLKWKRFHDLVNRFWWLGLASGLLLPFIVITRIISWFDNLKAAVKNTVDFIIRQFSRIKPSFSWWDLLPIPGAGAVRQGYHFARHPHFAYGGTMPFTGTALVGERGPELVNLPGRARITPIEQTNAGKIVLHVIPGPVYMDGKKVGRIIASAVTDQEARQ